MRVFVACLVVAVVCLYSFGYQLSFSLAANAKGRFQPVVTFILNG